MTPADQYELLVDSLRLVAASPEVQLSSLPDFVCAIDEVVMTFTDAFLLVPQLQRAGLVSTDAVGALKRLDDLLKGPLEFGESTDAECLRSHAFFVEARLLATAALQSLCEDPRPPTLSHIAWVKG